MTTEVQSEVATAEETPQQSPEPITHKHHVKMQRLAKKRRLFLVQKLTRRIKVLKGKKGTEQQISKNQRKVERLLTKLDELKQLNLEAVIADLVSENFTAPSDPESSTTCWFKSELLLDKFSFMAFVNPLLGLEPERKRPPNFKDWETKKKQPPPSSHRPQYKEQDDEVLRDILTVKKNRAGQRARRKQWEEKYGEKAKHLAGEQRKKKGEKRKPQKAEEGPSAQEIMKRLKAEEKVKRTERSEHPSWLAKKQQASKSAQIDVFTGTKTTFDDDSD